MKKTQGALVIWCISNAATATGALSETEFHIDSCISYFTICFPNEAYKEGVWLLKKCENIEIFITDRFNGGFQMVQLNRLS